MKHYITVNKFQRIYSFPDWFATFQAVLWFITELLKSAWTDVKLEIYHIFSLRFFTVINFLLLCFIKATFVLCDCTGASRDHFRNFQWKPTLENQESPDKNEWLQRSTVFRQSESMASGNTDIIKWNVVISHTVQWQTLRFQMSQNWEL